MSVSIRTAASLLLTVSLAAGCRSAGVAPAERTVWNGSTTVQQAGVVDIAVQPIQDRSSAQALPLDTLRAALCRELVERGFSPLDTGFSDRLATEASFGGGAAGPDAVLGVEISEIDDADYRYVGCLWISGKAQLVDARHPDAPALLSVDLTRRISLEPTGNRDWHIEELRQRGSLLFAKEVAELIGTRQGQEVFRESQAKGARP